MNAIQADWGPHIEAAARWAAPLLAATYVAGWWLGRQIHTANDLLAHGQRLLRNVNGHRP